MRTAFTDTALKDPHLKDAEANLRKCVHCGFCTATCPTYLVLGDERDSPRGRIALMQNMLESDAPPLAETVKHLDRCLSCLGCRTTCPSGVDYAALIDTARGHIEQHYHRPDSERRFRAFVLYALMHPFVFGLLVRVAKITRPLLFLLPKPMRVMAAKAPLPQRLTRAHHQTLAPARIDRRVAILPGCVQRALAPEIDLAASRVLARRNVLATPLKKSGCCGSLALHMGQVEIAKISARELIAVFESAEKQEALVAVLITATGCAAFIKDYPRLFLGDAEWAPRAERLALKLRDFSELTEPRAAEPLEATGMHVAYHPPCSLQHGQRLTGMVETLLETAGYRVSAIEDGHLCCGSAGSYSVLQPEISAELRSRKLSHIRATGAKIVASGNLGCLTQLSGADSVPTIHVAELVDWAEGGPKPPALK